jgi:DNA-binding response OmpR family regulator
MSKKHVLIVEDEVIIALDIKKRLENFGFIVDEVADCAEDALFYVAKYAPDLVLMDIKLNGEVEGTQIVSEIQNRYKIPVVYLTSHSDEETLRIAQDTKPFGYLLKPVEENQLKSTVLIALSRFEEENKLSNEQDKIIKINRKYQYNFTKKKLYYVDKEIIFGKKEKEFINLLVQNLDDIVPSRQIIMHIWKDENVSFPTLRSLIRRTREKIPDDVIEFFVEGYKFNSKLKEDEKR